MGDKSKKQDNSKLKKELAVINIQRVLLASVFCSLAIPVLMILNKLNAAGTENMGIVKWLFIAFELFSIAFVALSFLSLKSQDVKTSRPLYRAYWLMFEIFSCAIVCSDIVEGSNLAFYCVMLATMLLVPVLALSEMMHCMVIQLVFVLFLSVKFDVSVKAVFDIVLINSVLFILSRAAYHMQIEVITLKEKVREIRNSEDIDLLTKLFNRRGLEKRVYSSIVSCVRDRHRISILNIDIDDLDEYNDSFGIDKGDECIITVSRIIKQIVLRNTDVICRLDGGRFIAYLIGGDDMEPVNLAEKVRTAIEHKHLPQGKNAVNPFLSVSIGVASIIPKSENDFLEIYDESEEALFEAKERGKNIIVYDEQMYGSYMRKAN